MDKRTTTRLAADPLSRARTLSRSSVTSENAQRTLKALKDVLTLDVKITPENTLAIRNFLERILKASVQIDGELESFARGLLADVLVSDYLNRWNEAENPNSGRNLLREAERQVQKALALYKRLANDTKKATDNSWRVYPGRALTHYANGLVHRANGKHIRAFDEFEEALHQDPNFARAYAQKGSELINLGYPHLAQHPVKRAISLGPKDPSLGMFYWNLGRAYFFEGNYQEAVQPLREAVRLRPNLWHNWLYLVSAHALIGNKDDARKILARFRQRRDFKGLKFNVALVKSYEAANPNKNELIIKGREKFHEGLVKAGMTEI
jgi:adenylate cyclase